VGWLENSHAGGKHFREKLDIHALSLEYSDSSRATPTHTTNRTHQEQHGGPGLSADCGISYLAGATVMLYLFIYLCMYAH